MQYIKEITFSFVAVYVMFLYLREKSKKKRTQAVEKVRDDIATIMEKGWSYDIMSSFTQCRWKIDDFKITPEECGVGSFENVRLTVSGFLDEEIRRIKGIENNLQEAINSMRYLSDKNNSLMFNVEMLKEMQLKRQALEIDKETLRSYIPNTGDTVCYPCTSPQAVVIYKS